MASHAEQHHRYEIHCVSNALYAFFARIARNSSYKDPRSSTVNIGGKIKWKRASRDSPGNVTERVGKDRMDGVEKYKI